MFRNGRRIRYVDHGIGNEDPLARLTSTEPLYLPECPDDEVSGLPPQYTEDDKTPWTLKRLWAKPKRAPVITVTAALEEPSSGHFVRSNKEPSLLRRIFTNALSNAHTLGLPHKDESVVCQFISPPEYRDVRLHAKKWHNVEKLPQYYTRFAKAPRPSQHTFEPFIFLRKAADSTSETTDEGLDAQHGLDLQTAAEYRPHVFSQAEKVIRDVEWLLTKCEACIYSHVHKSTLNPDPTMNRVLQHNNRISMQDYIGRCEGPGGIVCADFVLRRVKEFVWFVGKRDGDDEVLAHLGQQVEGLKGRVTAVLAYKGAR
ncbi:hypothetical protein LTR85_010081 [Meristemomyces frigidus]|nr:hypothetical protein LTR85_010081 [Meristemomyces frigidus]